MGDAVRDGDVHADGNDQTIDAVAPPDREPGRAASIDNAHDYAELGAVDRAHYAMGGEIAKGGMGRVVEARDLRLGRRVAIKELLPKNRDAARRFEREARITARLQHPAIIHVYEAGTWPGGEPFYAMPRVDGRSLDKVVAERATLADRLGLVPHAIAVADALAYAHDQGVVHRDLKPSNVLVGEFGETVVIDWGLAKELAGPESPPGESLAFRTRASTDATLSGGIVGTPAYMPPEQARGEPIDQRADVYAIGALLYKVLSGRAPYEGATAEDIVASVTAGPPPPLHELEPGTPRDLAAIVGKAMARAAAARYATAGALAADLKRFQTGQLVAAHRYTARQLVWRWLRRYRVVVAIAAAAIVAIAIVATVSVKRIVAEKARAEAKRYALLSEHGRYQLLDGHPGEALAYLVGAAGDGALGGARGFLIADAMRPFQAQRETLESGPIVAVAPDGVTIATAGGAVYVGNRSLGDFGRVRALAWDARGTYLAAGGDDGIAHLWAGGAGDPIELRGHRDAILDVAFDRDARHLVTASADGTAIVWDIATRAPIATSKCHSPRAVSSARFSADATRVVTASADHTACVWSAANGATLAPLRGHTGAVHSAAWLHDDEWVVTASDDGTARVWNAARGTPVSAPLAHDDGTNVAVAIASHDGLFVLTAGSDRTARLWRLPEQAPGDGASAPMARKVATLVGHDGPIVAAAFSDDDRVVATASVDRTARLWDRDSGRLLATFEHRDEVTVVAFGGGGDRLVTGSGEQAAVWTTRTDKSRKELDSHVHALAAARDGTIAVGTDDSRVTLIRGETTTVLRGHMARVFAVAFTPDGSRLISAGEDSQPLVWDVATGKQIGALGDHVAPVRALAVSPDGALVASATTDGVLLWHLASRDLRAASSTAEGSAGSIAGTLARALDNGAATANAVAFDGPFVYAGDDFGGLVAWRADDGRVATSGGLPTAITALAVSPRDGALAVASGGRVELYRRAAIADVARASLVLLDNAGAVRALAFSRDGTRLVTGGDEGVARVWDTATGNLLGHRDARGRALEALAIDGDTLWLGSADGTITAADVRSDDRPAAELAAWALVHDPWHLDDHDIIRLGGTDGKR